MSRPLTGQSSGAECLLGWLRHVGREAGVASKRFAAREEEIWARERERPRKWGGDMGGR